MNLTDLQMELRAIEEHISVLHHQIEKMKPQTADQQKTDFEKITKLAAQHPLVNTKIKKAPKEVKKLIIGSLFFLVLAEKADIYSRLLYLCRLSKGSGYDISAEELYQLGLAFERSDLDRLDKELADYKYTYLVESLIVANLSEKASAETLSLVADLAKLMNCDKEEMRVLGMMAKSVLIGNPDYMLNMSPPTINRWGGKLEEFISSDWIVKQRNPCGFLYTIQHGQQKNREFSFEDLLLEEVSRETVQKVGNKEYRLCEIKECLQTGSIVKKGDIICTYIEKGVKKRKSSGLTDLWFSAPPLTECDAVEKTVKAPCDGVAYFIKERVPGVDGKNDEYIAIYVVSYFDDYSELSIWHKATSGASASGNRQVKEGQQ